MSSESREGGFSNGTSCITLNGRVWNLNDKISAVLKRVATKKEMAEKFGGLCPTTTVQGVIFLFGSKREIFVQWQWDSGQVVLEYSKGHSLFKIRHQRWVRNEEKNFEKIRCYM